MEEDDPGVHPSLQALTRLSDPSVSVVCLTPEERVGLRRTAVPSRDEAKELLRRSVSLVGRGVVAEATTRLTAPSGWQRSPLLRHHLLLELDAAGGCDIGPYRLTLDNHLGLLIVRRG